METLTDVDRDTLTHIRRTLTLCAGHLADPLRGEVIADGHILDRILFPFLHDGVLSDLEACKLATQWHGGGGTACYVFASTGAILPDLGDEITSTIEAIEGDLREDSGNREDLRDLRDYVDHWGERGAVWAWHRRVMSLL